MFFEHRVLFKYHLGKQSNSVRHSSPYSIFINPNAGLLVVIFFMSPVVRLWLLMVQLNAFNPEADNLKHLIFLQVRKIAQVWKFQGPDPRGMLQKPCKSVCTLSVVVSPDPLSPTQSPSSALKTPGLSASLVETEDTPENKKLTLVPFNLLLQEIFKWNTHLISGAAHIQE